MCCKKLLLRDVQSSGTRTVLYISPFLAWASLNWGINHSGIQIDTKIAYIMCQHKDSAQTPARFDATMTEIQATNAGVTSLNSDVADSMKRIAPSQLSSV